jgi:hypothetical protein
MVKSPFAGSVNKLAAVPEYELAPVIGLALNTQSDVV